MALQEQKYIFSQCSSETRTTEGTKSRLEKTVKVAIWVERKGPQRKAEGGQEKWLRMGCHGGEIC
jgi:hypothetical protein